MDEGERVGEIDGGEGFAVPESILTDGGKGGGERDGDEGGTGEGIRDEGSDALATVVYNDTRDALAALCSGYENEIILSVKELICQK